MKRTAFTLLTIAGLCINLSSCESFLQGLAGYGNVYNPYGVYNPYATPIGVLPYHLQPEVFAEQAKKTAEQSAQQAAQQVVQNAQQFQNMMNAVPVTPAYVPVSGGSSTESSSSYNNSNNYSGSSSGKNCQRCMGSGRCKSCNGKGYYDVIGIGTGRHACPNCASNHNGKCASCNGTGKM